MPKGNQGLPENGSATEVLRDILITQLGIAGVPQQTIRNIVGCRIDRVNRIVRHLKPRKHDVEK